MRLAAPTRHIYGNYSSLRIRCLIMYQSRLCFEIAVPTAVLRSTSTAACYLPRGGRCRWLLRTGVTVLFYFFAHTYTSHFVKMLRCCPDARFSTALAYPRRWELLLQDRSDAYRRSLRNRLQVRR